MTIPKHFTPRLHDTETALIINRSKNMFTGKTEYSALKVNPLEYVKTLGMKVWGGWDDCSLCNAFDLEIINEMDLTIADIKEMFPHNDNINLEKNCLILDEFRLFLKSKKVCKIVCFK